MELPGQETFSQLEDTLGIELPLPAALAEVRDKVVLSRTISGEFGALKRELIAVC